MLGLSVINMERVAVITGLIAIALALMTFASSRSFASLTGRLGWKPLNNRLYKGYYKYHATFWSLLAFALFFHISMGLVHIALSPFLNDPDAYLHRYTLTTGLLGLGLIGAVVTSCRSLLGFFSFVFLKNPLSVNKFQSYYRLHSYFWLIFLLPVIGHFIIGYIHNGKFWPG